MMFRTSHAGISVVAVALCGAISVSAEAKDPGRKKTEPPPPARAGDLVDQIHGRDLPNPFAWLENLESSEVIDWVSAHDSRTRNVLSEDLARVKSITGRMAQNAQAPLANTPARRGGSFFFMVDSVAHSSPALYINEGGKDRVLATGNDFGDIGMPNATIQDFSVSPQGKYVAVVGVDSASSKRVLRILDVFNSSWLPDEVKDARLSTDPWSHDEGAIFYATRDGNEPAAVWRHDLGKSSQFLYPKNRVEGKRFAVNVISGDNGLLVIEREPGIGYRAVSLGGSRDELNEEVLLELNDGYLFYAGSAGNSDVYLHLAGNASGDRIERVSGRGGEVTRETVLVSDTPVTSAHLFGNRLVLNGTEDGKPVVIIHSLDGQNPRKLYPPYGLTWTNFPPGKPAIFGSPGDRYAYLNSLALSDPGIYEIDLHDPEIRPWRLQDSDSAGTIITRQHSYRSHDGTEVPVAITHKKVVTPGSDAPVLVWVYGAHAFTAIPFFNQFFRAFINAGGVFVMPQVRGGGVNGLEWYAAGSGVNKPNTVADTVASLEWLVSSGMANPQRLVLMGNSAGTVPVAAAALQRPELMAAVILEVPLSDMVRHSKWTGGWSSEFGDPGNPIDFEAILQYSPYQLLLDGHRMPPTIVFAGENDPIAPPHHAYKLAAAYAAGQSGNAPVLLRLMRGAGHQLGVSRADRIENQSLQLAFLNLTGVLREAGSNHQGNTKE